MNKSIIQDLLSRPISFNPAIARAVGGVKSGLFLCQLIYWSDKGKDSNWIYKTQAEWEEETCLSRAEQETARFKLVSGGFIHEKREGAHGTLHYRINWDALQSALTAEKPQSSMRKTSNHQCGKPAMINAENQQSFNTEITTEITTGGASPSILAYQDIYLKTTGDLPKLSLRDHEHFARIKLDYGLSEDQAADYMRLWGKKLKEEPKYWSLALTKFDGELIARLDKDKSINRSEEEEILAEVRRFYPDYKKA